MQYHTDVPPELALVEQILEKCTSNGMLVEVYLAKTTRQYEAALFVEGRYKPGPPVPRELDSPSAKASYWMGVRPKVGFSQEEGDDILTTLDRHNKMHHCVFMDKWGTGC